MNTVTAYIAKENFKTSIIGESHQIIADEPVSVGGTEQGMSPTELLASALASCICITLRMYADRKNWDLQEAIVTITFERSSEDGHSKFTKDVRFVGNLDEEQTKRLKEVANNCPVHKTLTQPIEIVSV